MPTRPTMASKSTRPAPPAPKHFRRHLLWHTWIRIVYKLFGLAPQSRCLIAWTVAQLTALIVYVCTLVTMRARIFDLFDTIGIYNAVFKGSTLLVTHLFILGEALYARASHRAVSAGLAEIDRICKRKRFGGRFGGGANGDYIGRAHSRNALVFWAYACLAIGSEAIIVGTVSRTPVWKLFWLATVVSVALSRLRHLQHAMCVRGLTARVRIVRKALGRIAEAGLDDTAQAAERLAELQMLAGAVYEISSHMERIFGLSQLLNLMQNFVQLLCDLYWLYSMLHINELHALTEIIINLIPTVLALVILMEACEDCMHQVRVYIIMVVMTLSTC